METHAITLKSSYLNKMTEEEFFLFCQENKELKIERSSNQEIIVMAPTGSYAGSLNNEVSRQLANWNVRYKKGITFDSSAGFTLPDHSIRSPDASWVMHEKWDQLTLEEKKRFAPVCPDFVVELKSASDELKDLQEKMKVWIKNGCRLGWLIDVEAETVYVYKAGDTAEVTGFNRKLSGEEVLKGFQLDLSLLKRIQ